MADSIQMVDLRGQYLRIKDEVDSAVMRVIDQTAFIGGPAVKEFAAHLEEYLGAPHVIPCANGTDALQISLMALGLKPGDEVIVPAFTYVASAEVIGLLGLTPVMVDVDPRTFNISIGALPGALSAHTRAIIPVHLFGQSCDMEPLLAFAREHNLYVIEDNAQAIGAKYTFSDGRRAKTGTMGTIGCTSFFPSKNLGCFGDGGAIITSDDQLAESLRMIANHGQRVKYHHDLIGCNSRLDTLQAAVLDVKLRHLDDYCAARAAAASYYTDRFKDIDPGEQWLQTPVESPWSTHVYHQYTVKVVCNNRDNLKAYLAEQGIPSMVYYPLPLQQQEAFKHITRSAGSLENSSECARCVLSLPMHTELTKTVQDRIIKAVISFFE